MIQERMEHYPVSGEINRRVSQPEAVMQCIEQKYATADCLIDRTAGLSLEFEQWRFNLRMSNTEPLLRLNVETKGDPDLMKKKTNEILAFIDSMVAINNN